MDFKECEFDSNVVYNKWLPTPMKIVKNSTKTAHRVFTKVLTLNIFNADILSILDIPEVETFIQNIHFSPKT